MMVLTRFGQYSSLKIEVTTWIRSCLMMFEGERSAIMIDGVLGTTEPVRAIERSILISSWEFGPKRADFCASKDGN